MDDEMPASAKNAAKIAVISSIIIAIVFIVGIIGYVVMATRSTRTPTAAPISPSTKVTSTISPPISPQLTAIPLTNTDIQTYTSTPLGIEFTYNFTVDPHLTDSTDTVRIQEVGNKIFVYPSSLPPEQGQFIEVFDKNANEPLETAIRRLFLAGKDPARCLITAIDDNDEIKAEITFPPATDGSMDSFFENSAYCSEEYAQTNGLRYFIQDKTYPDKFIFVSIGQYTIYSDTETPWQDTIEIIN